MIDYNTLMSAGDSGAFNAGKEASALLTDIASVFTGGYGTAKGFAKFTGQVTSFFKTKGMILVTDKL